MMARFVLLPLLSLLSGLWSVLAMAPAMAAPGGGAIPNMVRVELVTSVGRITVAVDVKNAPKTAANFLTYVDDGRLDGTTFYRAARRKADPKLGYIQGGIRTDLRRALPPVVLEPTSQTGLHHGDGVISMARKSAPNSATGNFILTIGATPYLDARGSYPGYAAFGRVVAGKAVMQRILAVPTGGGTGEMKGQMILRPITLIRAKRLDGTPRPSGRPKAWMLWKQ